MRTRLGAGDLTIWFGEQALTARSGDSVAVALLAAGIMTTRYTPISGAPRGPYCMMGAWFECLAEVDGRPNTQTCMTPVRDGMIVKRQDGARTIGRPGQECGVLGGWIGNGRGWASDYGRLRSQPRRCRCSLQGAEAVGEKAADRGVCL